MMVFLWRRKSAELRVRCVSFLHLRSRRAEKTLISLHLSRKCDPHTRTQNQLLKRSKQGKSGLMDTESVGVVM